MKILSQQLDSTTAPQTPVSTDAVARPKVQLAVTAANRETSGTPANSIPLIASVERDVTFRKDPSGRVYYVVSDPQSGAEIREVPAETVRKIGESIDEYLKQEAAKATSHVNVKA